MHLLDCTYVFVLVRNVLTRKVNQLRKKTKQKYYQLMLLMQATQIRSLRAQSDQGVE